MSLLVSSSTRPAGFRTGLRTVHRVHPGEHLFQSRRAKQRRIRPEFFARPEASVGRIVSGAYGSVGDVPRDRVVERDHRETISEIEKAVPDERQVLGSHGQPRLLLEFAGRSDAGRFVGLEVAARKHPLTDIRAPPALDQQRPLSVDHRRPPHRNRIPIEREVALDAVGDGPIVVFSGLE